LDRYLGITHATGETIVQQAGREQGFEVQVMRPPLPAGLQDPQIVLGRLREWHEQVSAAMSEQIPEGIRWEESPSDAYVTDKPDWKAFCGLVLLAARDDLPGFRIPARVPTGRAADAMWRTIAERYFPSIRPTIAGRLRRLFRPPRDDGPPVDRRYAQIIGPELWLPADFPVVIEGEDVTGTWMSIGSSAALLGELELLNARTIRASDQDLDRFRTDGPPEDDEFEPLARFGLSVFLGLAGEAVRRRLPLKLDY
jgi:hypothetical protein